MNRYEAEPERFSDYWHVCWPTGGSSEPFTEAEASIIAFALNAVAEGDRLEAVHYFPNGTRGGKKTYDGPTDGVAP